ncbi:hypothetical protein ABID80_000615 [Streptomyces sp. PvP037]
MARRLLTLLAGLRQWSWLNNACRQWRLNPA